MEREGKFLPAVAAVLFLGLCAYLGAELGLLAGREYKTAPAELMTVTVSVPLEGTALRQERVIRSSSEIIVKDGERVAAGEVLTAESPMEEMTADCSCIYCEDWDGYEFLCPSMAVREADWDFQGAEGDKPRRAVGRLVTSRDWYYAARVKPGGGLPQTGGCRIRFEGLEDYYPACVMWAEEGRVLLRLTCFDRVLLSLRFCRAELISEEHTGLKVPMDAVLTDEDGNNYVYILTGEKERKTAVELIYSRGEYALVRYDRHGDGLKEGQQVIYPGTAIERKG